MNPSGAAGTAPRPAPPAPESLTERQHARRDRIVAAAVDFMIRDDYDTIQMKDVAAAAGVALGTLYRYFTSKEHLFAEALVQWSQRFPTEPVGRSRTPSADRVKKAYRRAVCAFERNPPVYTTFLVLEASKDPLAAEIFARFGAQRSEAFATFLSGMPSPAREDVVGVMSAVLGANLRDWSLGRQPIAAVYHAVDRAAELLLR